MKKNCDGFIFPMTLCIILVISLLLLTCMQHVLLFHKAINRREVQHQSFYQLEDVAVQLLNSKSKLNENCVVHGDRANGVIEELIQNEGCSLKVGQTVYSYILEDLGEFPCLVLYQDNKKFPTHHIRITVLEKGTKEHPTVSIIQLRYIKMNSSLQCSGEEHTVTAGISSWRYVPDYPKFSS